MVTVVAFLQFTGILVVGLVEGITHVNWTVANRLILWWALATIPVFLFPAFLTWQGTKLHRMMNLVCLLPFSASHVALHKLVM